ncbi:MULTISPECIES: CYTH and CHAD domain-containing protein [unclassified Arthrobacter]|uniref:CYTH and CHAD domain-containing protein n=1 Tax=unclassified Arthrobacter TaxID=235627 RepID=UPI001D134D3B|nr:MULTISPECIES: CHAD domain-containing protein [unclassified Arthrobacter]MCC3276688.1 CHAD domain-containing protein [Arthrobacter sp. zg-Y20]MCC9178469.1 CHAD domain-containing protein [Arthrobacter sp. zg-Y750]MDK1316847.1 CHAD domain-containing protein [Arthrobacter sp. zg.Y20]WIB06741.1 CHAD domain-containing protein [Arthrobacter sp. zg-Y20]
MVAGTGTESPLRFSAAEALMLPPLHELPAVAAVGQPRTGHRSETRYDTEDSALRRHGLAVSRISDEDGTHWVRTALPGESEADARTAAAGDPADVPPELVDGFQAVLRGRPLEPVETAEARVTTYPLLDSGGGAAGWVADETVEVHDAGAAPGAVPRIRRNWIAAAPDTVLADQLEALLRQAGADPAEAEPAEGKEPAVGPEEALDADSPVGDLLQRYLREQFAELLRHEPRVRRGEPDGVHKMRVATRRLRSALASYRTAVEREPARSLRGELRWLARVLGEARDAQVMRHRLRDLVEAEPVDLVMGPVAARIDEELLHDYRQAYGRIREALGSGRYFSALDRLETLLAEPVWTTTAADPAGPAAARMIRRDRKRLHRRVREARDLDGDEYAEAMHEARKDAKRLRYAAEVWEPVAPKEAGATVEAAEHMQKILGEYQDSVVTRAYLRRMGAAASAAGENGFTYGRLHALEQANAEAARERFAHAWKGFPSSP